jgi:hypothetical protein
LDGAAGLMNTTKDWLAPEHISARATKDDFSLIAVSVEAR